MSLCRLCQFLRPPVANERPSRRHFEISPLIDRQDNLRESGGRQVLPLAGQLRDGAFHVTPVGGQGSHHLAAMASANALAVVEDGDGVAEGETLSVIPLDEVPAG